MNNHLFSLIISGLFSFVACFYAPLCSYWYGVNEFPFTAWPLFSAMLLPFVVLWAVTFIFLRLLAILFPYKPCFVFGREIRISLPDALLLACVSAIWLEGSLLSKGLPSVTGEPGLFESTPRLILDTVAWLAVFTGVFFVWKKATRAVVFLTAAMAVIIVAGLGDAYLKAGPKVPVRATAAHVYENISFHPEENVLIIVADGFPTYMAERILRSSPDLAAELDGFILLKNNLATGGQTSWAIPAILQGAIYEGGDYQVFAEKAFTSPDSIPQFFFDSGWNSYISSILSRFCAFFEGSQTYSTAVGVQINASLYTSLLFKFLPYTLKQTFEHIVVEYTLGIQTITTEARFTNTSNSWFKDKLIPRLDHSSLVPTGQFHHYYGVHHPYRFNAEGHPLPKDERDTPSGLQANCEWELRCFIEFLKVLKVRNMYDGATIILTADHGDLLRHMTGKIASSDAPLLLVKPRNSTGFLEFSDIPSSSALLPKFVQNAHKGRQLFLDFLNSLPDERKIFLSPSTVLTVLGRGPENLVFKTQDIDTNQKPTKLKLGQEYTFSRNTIDAPLAVPVSTSGAIYLSGGIGLDVHPGTATLQLAVDCELGKVDIFLQIYFYQYKNMNDPGIISLTITDINSGKIVATYKEEKLLANKAIVKLDSDVKTITVARDKTINLHFQSDSPKNCLYAISNIIIQKHKE